jgi:hypothetical protein
MPGFSFLCDVEKHHQITPYAVRALRKVNIYFVFSALTITFTATRYSAFYFYAIYLIGLLPDGDSYALTDKRPS